MDACALPVFFNELETRLTEHLAVKPSEIRRLFHGRGRCFVGLEQLTADWLGDQLLVTLFIEPEAEFLTELTRGLLALSEQALWQQNSDPTNKPRAILVQHRKRASSPIEILWGELEPRPVVCEQGLNFQLDLGRNQNHGLFLDMRLGREWVRQQAEDKRVLNLFAYTCGFSVAALKGGAKHVVNLDMARGMLNRGRENHKLNEQDLSQVTFLGHDVFKSLGRLRKLGPYELVIIDPPSFQKGSFALTTDYHKILRRLPDLLTPNGKVLACVNAPAIPSQFLIDSMAEHAPTLQFVERLANPPEFADIAPEAGLKALVFKNN
ncbi:methyltransferase [Oceanisphaera profunda]|uniref:Methyltransferase n=1 Tax=Oceanisphaera profunda TaxID=1416627 RepID=A0A1Y0D8F3_9GAMM|nr:class I SAM-dependent methyltransferase [Oceanisphaera profunda]ART83843.1 methyltransferase [Oceanisphaera profunda]